ncbi:hypothetical protein A0H81_10208 [Grifola frondosa]|uniref:Uncharacterized protein n=1 Tax=Grifola frondosa TaxID=5627 RepID=A0A1C7LY63_GRIFR|nr:hypothetical protein A0H81_10208 [Grifola frondosa]
MSHMTPSVYLVWSILSCLMGAFLLFHLWKFDRFKCLRWTNSPYSGAFKRVMTYTYLLSIPCIIVYAVGFATIKYREGYTVIPGQGIIPTPWQLWPSSRQRAIFPLDLLFSIGWSFELVSHLEGSTVIASSSMTVLNRIPIELCFWLFLVNAGSVQQDWFHSLYSKMDRCSVTAVLYMPLVTIFTRSDPLKCEAYTFLAGSLGSLSLTVWFMPILFTFPGFLRNLKSEGIDRRTIVRLTTFHELNCLRVIFRFLFVAPLLILAVDGIRPHQHINENPFGTEFLAMVSGAGCIISSALTLVIFFPRSVESEMQSRDASREKMQMRTFRTTQYSERSSYFNPQQSGKPLGAAEADDAKMSPVSEHAALTPPPLPKFSPNRRTDSGTVIEGAVSLPRLTDKNLAKLEYQTSSVHPFVHNFTSPIDLIRGGYQAARTHSHRRFV